MKKIMLFESYIDETDKKIVEKVLDRKIFLANGPEIGEFENKIAEYFGKRHAISFNSGTSALYANLIAHKIISGEVIVPSFTFPATVNSVVRTGATPIFADIEKETLGLDVKSVKNAITEKTKAIMPIHFAGAVSRDIFKLKELAREYNLFLIEDNAQSLGATLNEEMAGSFGDSAALSFCFNKVLTTGEGGMVLTNDKEISERLKLIRSHGRNSAKDYVYAGLNLRMPTTNAALGLTQFKKLKSMVEKRRQIAKKYDEEFKSLSNVFPITYAERNKSVYCSYNLLFKNKELRDECMEFLKTKEIPTRISYPPVHEYSFYKKNYGNQKEELKITKDVSNRILTIPLHLCLDEEQQTKILESVNKWDKLTNQKNSKNTINGSSPSPFSL